MKKAFKISNEMKEQILKRVKEEGLPVAKVAEGVTPGMKISMGTSTTGNKQTPAEQQQAELDYQATYKCRTWSVDKAKFELPAGVKFMTFE